MHIGKLVASRVLPSECSHAPYFAADPQQRRDRCHDYSEQVIANKSHQHAGNGTYGFKDGTKANIPIKKSMAVSVNYASDIELHTQL